LPVPRRKKLPGRLAKGLWDKTSEKSASALRERAASRDKGAQRTTGFEELLRFCGAELWVPLLETTPSLFLSPRDRRWPQVHRSGQRHRAAVPSRPGLSLLPRPAGLERLAADNTPLGARYLSAPSREKRFLPFHLIFPLWLRRGLWLGAHVATVPYSVSVRKLTKKPRT
jgi:hypothetical protein